MENSEPGHNRAVRSTKREIEHQIDMAGVIAERERVTVAGIGGDHLEYAVMLPEVENQRIAEVLQMSKMGKNKVKAHNLKIYTVMLYYLMKQIPVSTAGVLIIDLDFDKRSVSKAKKAALKLLRSEGVFISCRIEIKAIGYDGPAHRVCNAVHSPKNSRQADYVLTCEDCLDIMSRFKIS